MIGIFDSGSGGLTVLQAIRALAPKVDLFYVGDVANMPYGTKSAAELEPLTLKMMRYVRAAGATTLVSACNSISAAVIHPMLELLGVEESGIIEMVGPAIQSLLAYPHHRIAILATEATIHSGMYQRAAANVGLDVITIASPNLARLIEQSGSRADLLCEIDAGLRTADAQGADVVLLACTHYPLVRSLFEERARLIRHGIKIVDPAPAVAQQALSAHGTQGQGRIQAVLSADSLFFREYGKSVCGIRPEQITIASFEG